jgi:hypothetical protein
MANKKISQLTELTSLDKDNDILPIVDSSSNKTKKAKLKNLPLSDASKGQGLPLTYLTTTSTSVLSGTTIASYSFVYDSALKVVYIGSNITSIDSYAFNYCANVHSLKFAEGVTTINSSTFKYNSANKSTITSFPSTLTSIGGGCFTANKWNKGLRFNEGLTLIGSYCFNYNSFYEDFSLPDSLTTIGAQSFYNSSSYVNLNIGSGLTTLGSNAFTYTKFYFSVDPENQSFSAVDGALYEGTSLRVGNVLTGDYTLPNDVLNISTFAFKGGQRGNLNLNTNNVTSISSRAFYYNSDLKSITMGSSVTGIGNTAFAYGGGLTGINLYATTPPTLGSNAFVYCGVTDIHVPVGSSYGSTFGGLNVIKDL